MLEAVSPATAVPPSPAAGPVRTLPPAARLSLRIKKGAADSPRSGDDLFLDQPINRFSVSDDRLIARLGPDEWLIIGTPSESDKPATEICSPISAKRWLTAFMPCSTFRRQALPLPWKGRPPKAS